MGGSSVYAIVETGGKQVRVEPGKWVDVEMLPGEEGAEVVLDRVLLVADESDVIVGTPYVPGARVRAQIVKHGRGKKIIVFKYKPKKNYRKKQGHRQPFTRLMITAIER